MIVSDIPFYKRFSNRLAFWVLGLLCVGQFFSLLAVDRSCYQNAKENLAERIGIAKTIVQQAYWSRTASLQKNVQIMTSDYGFKQAFSSKDVGTISSAMNNHLKRIQGADWMILVSLEEEITANTIDPNLNGLAAPFVDLLEEADASPDFMTEGIGVFREKYAQIVIVPLLNPDVDAWVIVGFGYDDAFAQEIKQIARAEITVLDREKEILFSSTLHQRQRNDVSFEQLHFSEEMTLIDEHFMGGMVSLSIKHPQFQVLVQKSVDQELRSYFRLRRDLVLIFLINIVGFGLVVLRLARDISRPVSELTKATKEVEKGNLTYHLPLAGDDEMGHLLFAFDHMMCDLAEKEKIRNLLGKVVSQEIAEELLNRDIELGGEEKYVTMLFSDIRGFTNACEGEDPKRILDLLNIYLTQVATIIENKQGVVDKFIGDAVMALFGAPISRKDDAQHAVDSALAMESMLVHLNAMLSTKGYVPISIGIGIHSGIVVAGNMGSESRLNYTVIGDNVNLSARLEGLTKFYGVSTIVSSATKEHCNNAFLYLDCVQVKGKTEHVDIFSPLQEELSTEESESYESALFLYRAGDFEQSSIIFAELVSLYSRDLYAMYHKRCVDFVQHPPLYWDGVYRFSTK